MKNLERLIRCAYKDADFDRLCEKFSATGYRPGTAFDLYESDVYQSIEKLYLRLYPSNYSPAVLQNIVNTIIDGKQPFFTDELFKIAADRLLIEKDGRVEVKFDDLLVWNDFINVAPPDVYVAARAPRCQERCFLIRHDNERLYRILQRIGVAENHMHLNASGYSTELNRFAFIYKEIVADKKEADDLIRLKTKMLRLFLETFLRNEGNDAVLQMLMPVVKARSYIELEPYKTDFDVMRQRLYETHSDRMSKGLETVYSIERGFLRQCFENIAALPLFVRDLFNLYLVGLTQFHFQFTLDNIGMGFEKFQDRQDRKDMYAERFNKKWNDLLYQSVADKYSEEGVVSSVECRITPRSGRALETLDNSLRQAFQNARGEKSDVRLGYIFHFIKRPPDKKLSACDARRRQEKELEKQTRPVLKLLQSKSSRLLVGIDAAGDELNARPELFAPHFRRCRQIKPSLHFTYHAGEVYVSLCSGLRAIYETVEFLDFRRGDRLGHALALGADPQQLAETRMRRVAVQTGEYLDNLAWMYFMLIRSGDHPAQAFQLADRFNTVRDSLFGGQEPYRNIDIGTYVSSWHLRAGASALHLDSNIPVRLLKYDWRQNGGCEFYNDALQNETAQKLHFTYLYDDTYAKLRQKPVMINTDGFYLDCLRVCQNLLKKNIADKGIAIEVNPSSNRKIAPIDNFADLPLFHLNGHRLYSLENRPDFDIPVSVNTDDSAVFQTNLSMEYAIIAKTLNESGVRLEEIYDYIEYLGKNSMEQNFAGSGRS